jgi:RNA polymerase primary sigma factor
MYYSESLIRYFKSIENMDPLTREEEQILGEKIINGCSKSLNKLIQHNLRIVIVIAKRHVGQGVPLDDLIQEGNIGLLEAAQNFKPKVNKGKFISYAQLWIRKRINEHVAQKGRLVRLPHNLEYDIFKKKRDGIEVKNRRVIELDAPLSEDGKNNIGDTFAADSKIFNFFDITEDSIKVKNLMKNLDKREKFIISAFFGIDRDFPLSPETIGLDLGLSPTRVSQILNSAKAKLKAS